MTDKTPPNPTSEFDPALRLLPCPVTVLGAAAGDMTGGLTAAWVTRVSLDPPLLLVSVGHERFTYGLMNESAQFTVSLLAEGQVDQARLFGLESRRDVDKWAQVDHDLLGEGVPAFRTCAARFLCATERVFRTGDHDCFVGRVLTAEIVAGAPALPMRGKDYAPRSEA